MQRFENGISAFEDALNGVPPEIIDRSPAPGKWTLRQIAAHLADSELITGVRIRFIAAQPGSPLKAFDQDLWATHLAYDKLSLEESFELFRATRKATASVLRQLPEAAFSNTGVHEERGEVTLLRLVELYTDHAEHHSRQIRELRSKFAAAA
jgi:hypothetical protein